MKKTKIAAIVACAALLVLGMAFTAMAANKWVFQNGGWYAVDGDGDPVEGWVKGDDGIKYWADEDGAWVVDAWVADDTVYVGADGKKAQGWLKLANAEEDVEDYGDYSWWYFKDGAPTHNKGGKAKEIEGNYYCFDATGRMVSGWVIPDGDTAFTSIDPEETDVENAYYYCSGEDEGWAVKGWKFLYGPDLSETDADTESFWFYFNEANGIKFCFDTVEEWKGYKSIAGNKYTFDNAGRMLTGWVPSDEASPASASYALESGLGVKKGWVWAVGTKVMTTYAADDTAEHWFWFDKAGALAKATFTNANKSKTTWFALDEQGTMLSGLYAATVGNANQASILSANVTIPAYGAAYDGETTIPAVDENLNGKHYFYFGDEATDGSMKIGSQTISLNGDDYTIRFSKGAKDKFYTASGSTAVKTNVYALGASVDGVQDNKCYNNGFVVCGGDDYYDYSFVTIQALTSKVCVPKVTDGAFVTATPAPNGDPKNSAGYYPVDGGICVVNSDGKIIKSGSVKNDAGDRYKIEGFQVTGIKYAD